MPTPTTRSEFFAEAEKLSRGIDFLSAFVLFAAGVIAPLVDPISDVKERWRKS